ncbi:MAG: BolA family transcriptional regulator [Candidatus Melainabacteria bacterium]|nr:BolA family transcriptional regulator [Candidatus Melainabacteria bacterium]
MIALKEIERKIKDGMKVDLIEVNDLRGGDHIQIILVSPDFEGKTLVEKHKMIYSILDQEMKSNEIHALTLKTYAPSEWKNIKNNFSKDLGHSI